MKRMYDHCYRMLLVYGQLTRSRLTQIEPVQRRFTGRLSGLPNVNYSDMLTVLDFRSLQLRRLQQDLIYTLIHFTVQRL